MTVEKLEVNLPFPGFYYSWYDQEIDETINRDCEYFAEEWGVDVDAVFDAAFSNTDCAEAHEKIANLHCATWLEKFTDETGINLYSGFKFFGMTSPKYYNFETDRVFVQVPLPGLQMCFDACKVDGFKSLSEVIRDRFTSRDGFISFYSNRLEDWLEKPLAEWDCNELSTLLIATLAMHADEQDFDTEVQATVIEDGSGNCIFDVVNWGKVQEQVASNG